MLCYSRASEPIHGEQSSAPRGGGQGTGKDQPSEGVELQPYRGMKVKGELRQSQWFWRSEQEDKATLMGFPRSHLPNTKVPTSNSAQEEPRKFFVSRLLGEWPRVWVRLVCIWKSLVPTAEGLWAGPSCERRFRVCHESEVAQSCPTLSPHGL